MFQSYTLQLIWIYSHFFEWTLYHFIQALIQQIFIDCYNMSSSESVFVIVKIMHWIPPGGVIHFAISI